MLITEEVSEGASITPSPSHPKGLVRVGRRRNATGFTDVNLPRAVIGPLTVTRRRTKTGSRLRRSACGVFALRRRGTITEP